MSINVSQHAYEQWYEHFPTQPASALQDAFAFSTRVHSGPFAIVDGFAYHHNSTLDCYFVTDTTHTTPRIVTVIPSSRTYFREPPKPSPVIELTPAEARSYAATYLNHRPPFASDESELAFLIDERTNILRQASAHDGSARIAFESLAASLSAEIHTLRSNIKSSRRLQERSHV